MKSEVKEYMVDAKFNNEEALPTEPLRKILNCLKGFNAIFCMVSDFLERYQVLPSSITVDLGYGMKLQIEATV